MAPTPLPTSTDEMRPKDLNILITGYGPFRSVTNNPSWQAVNPLHGTNLDLSSPSPPSAGGTANPTKSSGRTARIQTLQLPVHYGHVLAILPLLYGFDAPFSPAARTWSETAASSLPTSKAGSEAASFSEGWERLQVPKEGWDVVLHVGVGRKGGVECETVARKGGYDLPDAGGWLAPLVSCTGVGGGDKGAGGGSEEASTSAGQRKEGQMDEGGSKAISSRFASRDGKVRGFREGYEPFSAVMRTGVDVERLVAWMRQSEGGGMHPEDIKQSHDAGLYLCEFVFYASLCEAERRARLQGGATSSQGDRHKEDGQTDVLFIHVPPVGERLDTTTCTDAIRKVAWYLAKARV